jgi:hypothetical protein
VTELALDDDLWHAFTGHLDRVGVAQLMRSEAPAIELCFAQRERFVEV